MRSKLSQLLREGWLFWSCCLLLGFVSGHGTGQTPSPRANFISGVTLSFLIAIWVMDDAKRRHERLVYDFPGLVFFFWPVFVPMYVLQTRGKRGVLTLLALLGFLFSVIVVGGILGALANLRI